MRSGENFSFGPGGERQSGAAPDQQPPAVDAPLARKPSPIPEEQAALPPAQASPFQNAAEATPAAGVHSTNDAAAAGVGAAAADAAAEGAAP